MEKIIKKSPPSLLVLIICLLFGSGCVSYSGFHKEKAAFGDHFIEPVKAEILSYDVADWRIGKAMKDTVSRGIKIEFSLPILKSKHLKMLNLEKGVDSILVKVIQNMGHRVVILGFLEIPLYRSLRKLRGKLKGSGRKFKQPEKAFLSIDYIASTIHPRMHQMICPPHHHNLEITKLKKRTFLTKRDKGLSFSSQHGAFVSGKVKKFLYQSQVFRGWKTLKGKYYLELAYYNSKEKKRLTNYYRLNEYVEVVKEREVKIKDCPESRTPFNGIRYKGKPFRWKRKKFF
jgi:hypothetical protein